LWAWTSTPAPGGPMSSVPERSATVLDVVCGMDVPAGSKYHRVYKGTDYRFCCGYCLARFAAEPERFLKQK